MSILDFQGGVVKMFFEEGEDIFVTNKKIKQKKLSYIIIFDSTKYIINNKMVSFGRYNIVSGLLCFLQLNTVNAWFPNFQSISPLRIVLSSHAVASMVLRQFKEESFQKQLDAFTYYSGSLYDNFVGNITPPVFHFTKQEILNTSNACCLLLFIASWIGYDYYNSTKSSMYKLNNLEEFKELQSKIRIVIMVLTFVFLRNIENAI
jgi:hypothetical protein